MHDNIHYSVFRIIDYITIAVKNNGLKICVLNIYSAQRKRISLD